MDNLPNGIKRNNVERALLLMQLYWATRFKHDRYKKRIGQLNDGFDYEDKSAFKQYLLRRKNAWNPNKAQTIENATAVWEYALKEAEKEGWLFKQ